MIDLYLLDTCAILWIVKGSPLSQNANVALSRSRAGHGALHVSSMSAWEIGMLISKGRLPTTKSATIRFRDAVDIIGAEVIDVSLPALIESSFLPLPIHNDPTDRILIATAREHDLTIITRDRAILSYGIAGHVRTLEC
ncbi:type II toxin-antitoxin system VapC family toxin [Neorhizobium tomejilense]|uniref:type II toxin-antitoxin system VapC family toxin n=1 Tax=Neorhizobium tomejilense TaxID=2093828 RepID=UPI000CF8E136|nr:type II toxin-antitoxin system VapC family toxin [Neorhizobium tomejilense]